jgi:hypothetical protein
MVGAAGSIVAAGCMVAAAVSLVVRLRRAGGEQRQQIKWLAYGGALVVCGVCAGSLTIPRSVPVSILIMSFSLLGLPILTGIAIVRHRLYDVDLLINRTLVYASLTAMLALVYVGGVVGLQAALRALTGQESTLAIVASTLAIAALFNPLRRRVQGFVDRRFYRRKYDAAKTLAAFNARLRDETDLNAWAPTWWEWPGSPCSPSTSPYGCVLRRPRRARRRSSIALFTRVRGQFSEVCHH